MNVRVTLGRLTHLRRLLSHFVPGHPSIRRSSAFAGYQRRGRGRQSRACGTRHSCVCELSVRRRRASALCSPWRGFMVRGRLFACDGAFRVSIGHHEVRARRIRARCDPPGSVSGICRDSSAASASDAKLRVDEDLATCRLRLSFACDDVPPRRIEPDREGSVPLAPMRQNSSFFLSRQGGMPATSGFRTGESGARAWGYLERALHVHRQLSGKTQDSRGESTQLSPRELQK